MRHSQSPGSYYSPGRATSAAEACSNSGCSPVDITEWATVGISTYSSGLSGRCSSGAEAAGPLDGRELHCAFQARPNTPKGMSFCQKRAVGECNMACGAGWQTEHAAATLCLLKSGFLNSVIFQVSELK